MWLLLAPLTHLGPLRETTYLSLCMKFKSRHCVTTQTARLSNRHDREIQLIEGIRKLNGKVTEENIES